MSKIRFPSVEGGRPYSPVQKPPSRNASTSYTTSYSTSRTANAGPSRSRSTSSATHTTRRFNGALECAMETLIEEVASVSVLASGSVLAPLYYYCRRQDKDSHAVDRLENVEPTPSHNLLAALTRVVYTIVMGI
ncbi:hypothetical protein K503DRAFT_132796 [Rhizopogon vinicolor AM-OR11-026]|uniref:Uncharacterized protein n=1 Tax=Rhizopogon vinicolor AM-OR11-026 TaxID=1314800 RepID=A0A1B7N1V6_9AGAM|nr:hypothetical protein K503DRAFT_132796 [Rhizopogon vinicolor AM-OR11-026]